MTITLTFRPEIEAGLLAKAHAKGMAVEDYLRGIVEQEVVQHPVNEPSRREEAVRRMFEFGDKHHLSFGAPITREALHEGHRF